MASSEAARRYARALFSLAKEERNTLETKEEFERLADLFASSPELRDALLTPLHPAKQRRAVLNAIAEHEQLSGLIKNFYSFLIDRRRLVDFPGIRDEFARLVDEVDSGLMAAQVTSATPLDERRSDRLRRALSERTGFEVKLEVTVDPDLIGGAIAKVGDLIFDGSIRTQLDQLRTNLTKGS